MSLATPQTVTINAVAKTLDRVEEDKTSSLYSNADGTYTLRVSHQKSKGRTRRMVRLDSIIIAADPLTAENAYRKAGIYVVIDEPDVGFTDTELSYYINGLIGWFSAGNITAVLSSRH